MHQYLCTVHLRPRLQSALPCERKTTQKNFSLPVEMTTRMLDTCQDDRITVVLHFAETFSDLDQVQYANPIPQPVAAGER